MLLNIINPYQVAILVHCVLLETKFIKLDPKNFPWTPYWL